MPINLSELGGSSGDGAPELWYAAPGNVQFPITGVAGVYNVRVWQEDYINQPTVTVFFVRDNLSTIISEVVGDPDTGSGRNAIELTIRVTEDFTGVGIITNQNIWLTVEFKNDYQQGTVLTTSSVDTSQTITFASPTTGLLFGAGGGGGGGGSGNNATGGGGGGSGYLQVVSIPAGTHELVCGAGGIGGGGSNSNDGTNGIAGTAGGSSTLLGVTAAGGQGGTGGGNREAGKGNGGNGGSGGGGTATSGGLNGSNGGLRTDGTVVGWGQGGEGSLSPLPFFQTPGGGGAAGGINDNGGTGGGGGQLYSGGGGGGGLSQNRTMSGAGGGGGLSPGLSGASGVAGGAGGAGGNGGLIYLNV